jgi:hypothetical protein
MPKPVPAASGGQPSPYAINAAQRQAVLRSSVDMTQTIASATFSPAPNAAVPTVPLPIGTW